MKILSLTILKLATLIILFVSCSNNKIKTGEGKIIPNKYAKGFEIKQISEGYILKVKDYFNQNENNNFNYLLSLESEVKSNSNVIIKIPVSKVVCLSTSYSAFISELNMASTIKGLSTPDLVFNSEISQLIRANKIHDVGYDSQINYEKILAISPDVVFAFGINNSAKSNFQKLTDAGIPVVFINDYLESTPLGRSEWIKFFACFYDKLNMANEYFDSIENKYTEIKSNISHQENKPKILVSLPWKGTWWVPGGNSYFANFIKDAGGEYIFQNNSNSESQSLNIEEVFTQAKDCDIWLHPNNVNSKYEILSIDSRLAQFAPYNTAKIFNNNLRQNKAGGNDFWESGILHPDIILQDLINIFSTDPANDYKMYYYKPIN